MVLEFCAYTYYYNDRRAVVYMMCVDLKDILTG